MPPNHKPIAVLLADDHAVVRKGTRNSWKSGSGMIHVDADKAADGAPVRDLLTQRLPDVAVLDVRMPQINGIDLNGKRIKATYPQYVF
ncbi:MAG: response regulator [Caldilineaceae bacterium]